MELGSRVSLKAELKNSHSGEVESIAKRKHFGGNIAKILRYQRKPIQRIANGFEKCGPRSERPATGFRGW